MWRAHSSDAKEPWHSSLGLEERIWLRIIALTFWKDKTAAFCWEISIECSGSTTSGRSFQGWLASTFKKAMKPAKGEPAYKVRIIKDFERIAVNICLMCQLWLQTDSSNFKFRFTDDSITWIEQSSQKRMTHAAQVIILQWIQERNILSLKWAYFWDPVSSMQQSLALERLEIWIVSRIKQEKLKTLGMLRLLFTP